MYLVEETMKQSYGIGLNQDVQFASLYADRRTRMHYVFRLRRQTFSR